MGVGDNLIPRADILGEKGHMQGGRAGIHSNCVFGSQIFGKALFKLNGAGTFGQPLGAQGFHHLIGLPLP